MIHIALFIMSIILIEILLLLDLKGCIYRLMININKAKVIINPKISDQWKEKVVPVYAVFIMKYSLKIILILFVMLFFLIMPELLIDGFINYLMTFRGILESIAFILIYSKLRQVILTSE